MGEISVRFDPRACPDALEIAVATESERTSPAGLLPFLVNGEVALVFSPRDFSAP
jgi:hypothetical protein